MNMLAHDKFECSGLDLTSVEMALKLLTTRIPPPFGIEDIPLHAALGRILAGDVAASISMPTHDNSAMDGFAFAYPERGLVTPFAIVGSAAAGAPFGRLVKPGECVRIATGALLPAGCDTVVMHEQCRVNDRMLFIQGKAGRALHIRRRGEDFAVGDVLLPQGSRLRPQDLGLLAAAGVNRVAVRPRLRVGILSTGNELCEGGECLQDGQIYDANRVMLSSFCKTLDIEVTDLGIVRDDCREIAAMLARSAKTNDIVIASAGTSHSEEDHLASAVMAWGGELIVSGVAIKPGKPVMFGKIGRTPLICLPGNPVAAITTFLVLALPFLRRLMGERHTGPKWIEARAQFAHKKKSGLREYLRVTAGTGPDGALVVEKLSKQGSAMLTSLAACDGFVCLDESVTDVAAGMMLPYCAISEFC